MNLARRKAILPSLMLSTLLLGGTAGAGEFSYQVPMERKSLATYYVRGDVGGVRDIELMVDTGASYMTINEELLAVLESSGKAEYVRDLTGVMADGSRMRVSVYRIDEITVGDGCTLRNVEAALFPRQTRMLLGLSALKKAAPFVFSTNPPALHLSNCTPTSS